MRFFSIFRVPRLTLTVNWSKLKPLLHECPDTSRSPSRKEVASRQLAKAPATRALLPTRVRYESGAENEVTPRHERKPFTGIDLLNNGLPVLVFADVVIFANSTERVGR